jgi:hypothetical protein
MPYITIARNIYLWLTSEENLSTKAADARESVFFYNRNTLTPTKKASPAGPKRLRSSKILDLMPEDLPLDSEALGRVLRHAFVTVNQAWH